ncbi:MAG: CHAT domain-containing protein [Rhodospirillaceae bacterium]|nr:CHAT domain-containing protein [Rhodospirillaceae bacterium]
MEQALATGRPEVARELIRAMIAAPDAPAPVIGAGALHLARIAQLSGNFAEAEQPLMDALRRLPAADVAVQPVLASIYVAMGDLALIRGDTTRAQIALLKGIAIARRIAASDDPLLIEAELSLAMAEIRAFRLRQAGDRLNGLASRIHSGKMARTRVPMLYQKTLAELHFRQYDFAPALVAQQRSLELAVGLYGDDHAEAAHMRTSLGSGLFNVGRYDDAEATLLQAISVYDRAPAFFAPAMAAALVNLGQVYYATGRTVLADRALSRALQLALASLGPGSQIEAAALLHRGYARLRGGDLPRASTDLAAAIDIWTQPKTASVRAAAGARIWLAEAERRRGNLAPAAAALAAAERTLARIFGEDSFALTDTMIGAGQLALSRGDAASAQREFSRAVAIRSAALGEDHLATLDARALLALALAETNDTRAPLTMLAADLDRIRARVLLLQTTQSPSAIEEINNLRRLIGHYVQAIAHLRARPSLPAEQSTVLLAQSFELAQLARSSAAGTAIAGMSHRFAAADSAVADALRALQEAQLRRQLAARQLTAMAVEGQAPAEEITAARAAVAAESARSESLQAALVRDHPLLARATIRLAVSLEEIQAALQPDEVLIAYLTLEERSYAWRISALSADLVELPGSAASIKSEVDALRATVDPKSVQSLSDIVPFATAEAWSLYRALLAPLDLPEERRHLIVVPDGTLQSLPFAALLQSPPEPVLEFADYRRLPWLIDRHELSVLPEISALTGLRGVVAASTARAPFVGFGDPVLSGQPVDPVELAADDPAVSVAALLRGLSPLPDSAAELAELALAFEAEPGAVHTGAAASEASVKALPLADYRVVAFATHGLMAGDFGRLREPGLVLTPPEDPKGEDDGLLTIGEIARLRLDANWVILSACNTAADDGSPGAEGLSGLARAFFFAGSRSLLVSQWEVLSVAAVQLTTGIFTAMAGDPELTRAGGLRRSILAMLAEDQPDYLAHPIFWAPFQVVGEGGH